MSDERIARLPAWARERLAKVERERDEAIRALNEYVDGQMPSPIYVTELECTGEEASGGPSQKVRYIQSRKVSIEGFGVHLEVMIGCNPGEKQCISLRWYSPGHGFGDVAFIPDTYCGARLVAKQYMRDR